MLSSALKAIRLEKCRIGLLQYETRLSSQVCGSKEDMASSASKERAEHSLRCTLLPSTGQLTTVFRAHELLQLYKQGLHCIAPFTHVSSPFNAHSIETISHTVRSEEIKLSKSTPVCPASASLPFKRAQPWAMSQEPSGPSLGLTTWSTSKHPNIANVILENSSTLVSGIPKKTSNASGTTCLPNGAMGICIWKVQRGHMLPGKLWPPCGAAVPIPAEVNDLGRQPGIAHMYLDLRFCYKLLSNANQLNFTHASQVILPTTPPDSLAFLY